MASEIRTNSITSRTGLSTISLTSTGPIFAGIATFTGSIGIAGTLTYEDVTNIDSVGIITARSGIKVTGGDVLTSGNTQLFGSDTSDGSDNKAIMINGGGAVSDSRGGYLLVHGNEHSSNPGITRLHAGNVGAAGIEMYTAGIQRLGIASDGIITAQKSATFGNTSDSFTSVNITSSTSGISELRFADTTSNVGYVKYEHSGNNLILATNQSERLRIDSSGNVGVGTNVVSDSTGNAQAFTIARTGVNGQVRLILKNEGTGFGNGAGFHQVIDGANVAIENRSSGGYLDFSTNNSGSIASRMLIASDGKVGISSSIPQRPLDVRGEVFANRFTAYSAPTSTYNNQTTGVKYGARGAYTLTLGGTRSSNTNSFTIFEAKDFNNSKYFCLEISFHHAGGGVHGSYRRFAGMSNGYTSITTLHDTGNVNVGGGLGFAFTKPDNHTLRVTWNGCSSFADSYTLYCKLDVSNGNTYFSAIDSAFY